MFPRALLQCPVCTNQLTEVEGHITCDQCQSSFPMTKDGVPIFVPNPEAGEVAVHTRKLSGIKKALRFLKPPHHSVYLDNLGNTHFEGTELQELIQQLPRNAKILNIGSLSRKLELRDDVTIYNVDISIYAHVDLIADGHHLPIVGESFDLVLLKNVLEHVQNPAIIVQEAHRVLKPSGILYIKNPFLQPFHAVPDDYYRWTSTGNKEFFQGFDQIAFDISIGPSSMLSWILREYLAMLFSLNSVKLYKVMLIVFGWLTFWIKYLDVFFRSHPMSHYLASAFYGIYRKR